MHRSSNNGAHIRVAKALRKSKLFNLEPCSLSRCTNRVMACKWCSLLMRVWTHLCERDREQKKVLAKEWKRKKICINKLYGSYGARPFFSASLIFLHTFYFYLIFNKFPRCFSMLHFLCFYICLLIISHSNMIEKKQTAHRTGARLSFVWFGFVSFRFILFSWIAADRVLLIHCLLMYRLWLYLLASSVSFDEHLTLVCLFACTGFRLLYASSTVWSSTIIIGGRNLICVHTSTPNGYTHSHTHCEIPFVEIGTKSMPMLWHAAWTKMRTCENKMESCYICLVLFCFNHLCLTGCFVLFVALQQLLLLMVYAFLMAFSLSRSHWKDIRIV